MWDLDTIRQMNEVAHREAVQRAEDGARQALGETHATLYPLAILSRMLITGPPFLSNLIDLLEDSESVAYFHELVSEYLPEHADFIMSQDNDGRMREFAYYFSRQYFPLSDNLDLNDFSLEEFCTFIPVDLMGFNYEDYHQFADFRDGYTFMLALLKYPYLDDGEGSRIPILERVRELVGKSLPEMIPLGGWLAEDLHRMLDGTKYAGAAVFADWVTADTGCWQLDANYTDYMGESWHRATVDSLTTQWPRVVELQEKIQDMTEWLEEDIFYHFQELLYYMLDRKVLIIPKEQMPFPLDGDGQIIGKEVAKDDNH